MSNYVLIDRMLNEPDAKTIIAMNDVPRGSRFELKRLDCPDDSATSVQLPVSSEEHLSQMKKMFRGLVLSGALNRGRRSRGKRGGGPNHLKHFLPSVFSSNSYSFSTGGVFTFVNKLYVQDGITSDASGIVSKQVALNPTVPTQWSSQSNLFDEYRIAEIRVSFVPNLSQTVKDGPVCMVIDDDDAAGTTAPTSFDVVMQYENAWWGNAHALPGSYAGGAKVPPYIYRCAPPQAAVAPNVASGGVIEPGLGGWYDVGAAATGTSGGLRMRGEGLTVSANIASYIIEYVMQFRMVR